MAERLLAELMELPSEALGLPYKDEPMPESLELDLVERIFFLRKTTCSIRSRRTSPWRSTFWPRFSGGLQRILDRKIAVGKSTIAVPREVSDLGAVPVGM